MSAPLRLPLEDITFIASFAAFCRAKPADEEYNFYDSYECALGQFGYPCAFGNSAELGVPEVVLEAVADTSDNFGELADRLERLIADAPVVRS